MVGVATAHLQVVSPVETDAQRVSFDMQPVGIAGAGWLTLCCANLQANWWRQLAVQLMVSSAYGKPEVAVHALAKPHGALLASAQYRIACITRSRRSLSDCCWAHYRDWRAASLLCKQKVAADLASVAFTEDNSNVLVAGKGCLKVSLAAQRKCCTCRSASHAGTRAAARYQCLACSKTVRTFSHHPLHSPGP
jgi:hypothetical protein